MNIRNFIVAGTFVIALASAQAEEAVIERAIKIIGRDTVTVTTPVLHFGDLAEISSLRSRDDDTVIGLQKIYIDRSPAPGTDMTLSAAGILEKLSMQGIDLSKVSYTLPRIVTVKRAARPILKEELRAAIEATLQLTGADAAVRDIRYSDNRLVSPGDLKLEAVATGSATPGQRTFAITATSKGEQPAHFEVNASVDEWDLVPVANRSVNRGSVIQAQDVVMARINLATIQGDVVRSGEDVIGLEANRDIPFGEVFRKDKLAIPPLVTAGSRVTMMYRNGIFEATASGIALESGIRGQGVRVRNEASKKVVTGEILESGLVGVKP